MRLSKIFCGLLGIILAASIVALAQGPADNHIVTGGGFATTKLVTAPAGTNCTIEVRRCDGILRTSIPFTVPADGLTVVSIPAAGAALTVETGVTTCPGQAFNEWSEITNPNPVQITTNPGIPPEPDVVIAVAKGLVVNGVNISDSGVFCHNGSGAMATVRFTLFDINGAMFGSVDRTIADNGCLNIFLTQLIAGIPDNFRGNLRIQVISPVGGVVGCVGSSSLVGGQFAYVRALSHAGRF